MHLVELSRHISKSKGKFKKEKIWNLSEGLRLSNWTASDIARPVPKQIFSLSQVHFITLLFRFIILKKCPFQTKFVLQYSSKSSWWDMCGKLNLKTSLLKMPQKKIKFEIINNNSFRHYLFFVKYLYHKNIAREATT